MTFSYNLRESIIKIFSDRRYHVAPVWEDGKEGKKMPSLVEDKPDVVIIHSGTNDLDSNLTEQEIADQIIDMGKSCRMNGETKVIIVRVLAAENCIFVGPT